MEAAPNAPSVQRLFGIPGAEQMQTELAETYELHIDGEVDEHDRRPRIIEEWSVRPPAAHFRSPADIIDWLLEDAADDGGEDFYDQAQHLTRDPKVLAAAEQLVDLLASRITYFTADTRLAEHTITWDDDGEPLVDGQPLYRRSRESTS